MRRALLLIALLGALCLPAPVGGASSSDPCPVYAHDQLGPIDGNYYVSFDRIFCRDASGTRDHTILRVTQGDPRDENSTLVARVEHTWLRQGNAWWGSTLSATAGDANVTLGAVDSAGGPLGGACAAQIKVTKDAFGASTTTPAISCPSPGFLLV